MDFVKLTCRTCKKNIPQPLTLSLFSWKKRKYCSSKCYGKSLEKTDNIEIRQCEYCHQAFSFRVNLGHKGRFCSSFCSQLWLEKAYEYEKKYKLENGLICSSKDFSDLVFKRDGSKCVSCGERRGKLQVDHIKPLFSHPQLRFDLNNGQVLCLKCHKAKTKKEWVRLQEFRRGIYQKFSNERSVSK